MEMSFDTWLKNQKQMESTSAQNDPGVQTAEKPNWEEGLQNPRFLEAEKKRLEMKKIAGMAASEKKDRLPCFPEEVYANLPHLLDAAVKPAVSDQERDLLLLGAMTTLSSCLPKVQGIYHNNVVFPNLFLFVSASASAGKGRLTRCRDLVMPIHREIREESERDQQEYQGLLAEQEAGKGAKLPLKPPGERVLLIPANNSGSGFVEQLYNSKERGLIFETEADTMTRAFKNEQCAYGESLRKAFHHEPIAFNRRTDKQYLMVEKPALSVLLSGTPRQVSRLFEDAEDGLFSRFLFYHMNMDCVWEDVFLQQGDMNEYSLKLGEEFHALYRKLKQRQQPLIISLTDGQKTTFNEFFGGMQELYKTVKDEYFVASVRRIANSCFRMMLLLSALRLQEQEKVPASLQVADGDFLRVLQMAKVLVKHSGYVITGLVQVKPPVLKTQRKELFWNALPSVFNTAAYHKIAAELNIPRSTADKDVLYVFKPAGIVEHVAHGLFRKQSLDVEFQGRNI